MKAFVRSDYYALARFLVPVAFTDVAVDIGEQFLNRSISHATNVVDTLAAFGLAYVIVKFFVNVLAEVAQAGLVLVQDRRSFCKILACVVAVSGSVVLLIVVTSKTQLGVWLIEDLHGVSPSISRLTHTALAYLSLYPLIDAVSWFHGGVLLRWHHSTLVGAASLANIIAQIFSVAILLYTPLVCRHPIAVPILAVYGGVITKFIIVLVGFYRMVYPNLKKERITRVTLWRLATFLSPLMLAVAIQNSSRPTINLLVARVSSSCREAAEAVAALTASYPFGRLPFGWLNKLRTVSPAFQKKHPEGNRRVVSGKKIGIFALACFLFSATCSFILFWVPGVSLAILENVVGLPHDLALLCVDPCRVFAFFAFIVTIRAALTGWLILHRQTKLVIPGGVISLGAYPAFLFLLLNFGLSGALLGVLALFCGFFTEMVILINFASLYACWRHWKLRGVMEEERPSAVELQAVSLSQMSGSSTDLDVSELTTELDSRTPDSSGSNCSGKTSDMDAGGD